MGKNLELKTLLLSLRTEIVCAFNRGKSCKQIKEKFSLPCSDSTILGYLNSWGVDTAHRHNSEWWGVDASRKALIFSLKEEGKSQKKIAEIIGISKGRIAHILNH